MIKKRRRHTAAYKFRIALEALEGSKTIGHSPSDRRPAEASFAPRWRQPAR